MLFYQWNLNYSIDWLILCCFRSRLRIFDFYRDVTTMDEGLRYLSLCSVPTACKQRGEGPVSFNMYFDTGIRFLWPRSKNRTSFYEKQEVLRTNSYPVISFIVTNYQDIWLILYLIKWVVQPITQRIDRSVTCCLWYNNSPSLIINY